MLGKTLGHYRSRRIRLKEKPVRLEGLVASRALGDAQAQLNGLHDQIAQLAQPEASVDKAPLPATVINALGQSTGSLVNVTD